MHVAYLFEFDLCEQPVQVNFSKVNLRYGSCANALLHSFLRVNHIDDRVEAHKLVNLLQDELRRLITTDVPNSNELGIWSVRAAHFFVLEADSGISDPIFFLENQLVQQSGLACTWWAHHEDLPWRFLRSDSSHLN